MDVLADVLALAGVRGTAGARIEAGEDWGWWAAASPGAAAFHAVTAGTAWLGVPGRPPLRLMPGEIVLLPTGVEHVLASDAAALARTGPAACDDYERTDDGGVRIGSGSVGTRFLCAHYEHDPAVATPVLSLLPDLVHIRAQDDDRLQDTVRLLGRELAQPQLATEVVLNRLVDVLLVQLLRAWLTAQPEPPRGSWLGVLQDPMISTAVARLHGDPARQWTTARLASELAVSRATLSRRFPAVVGETPGTYLTRWRMDLAARELRDTDDSLEAIASSVGYTSVYAFSRAFRRARGQPPGRYRATSRAHQALARASA